MTIITLDIPDNEAMALAQMCKRFGYDDAVRFATPHDGGRERDAILDGTSTLQRALAEAGFAPR
jgi:hypothetical protein